jgi:hypothetical protein
MMVAIRPHPYPVFDNQRSFNLNVESGEVAVSAASISRLLNDHVLPEEDGPLRKIDLAIADGRLKGTGTIRKAGISLPFSMAADVAASSSGAITLRPDRLRVVGIPVGALLEVLRLDLADLVKSRGRSALSVSGETMTIDPGRLIPAPRLTGRLTRVIVDRDRFVQTFGGDVRRTEPAPGQAGTADHYLRFFGGTLRFGKLTMSDADLQLIDADPSDPFEFDPERYVDQLVAGYSKNTRNGGLRVYMPDFDQVRGTDLRPNTPAPGQVANKQQPTQ